MRGVGEAGKKGRAFIREGAFNRTFTVYAKLKCKVKAYSKTKKTSPSLEEKIGDGEAQK